MTLIEIGLALGLRTTPSPADVHRAASNTSNQSRHHVGALPFVEQPPQSRPTPVHLVHISPGTAVVDPAAHSAVGAQPAAEAIRHEARPAVAQEAKVARLKCGLGAEDRSGQAPADWNAWGAQQQGDERRTIGRLWEAMGGPH